MSEINQKLPREQQVRSMLMAILAKKGPVYTCGILMGIFTRLSKHDYTLYNEIALRYEQVTGDELD
jgi:hypothetical protein